MNEFLKANKDLWDAWTECHETSKFYDVEGFRGGNCTLQQIEREELGDVSSKSLLHLQCHFGLDTLSWARLGAKVVGIDFSPKAIGLARALAAECNIPAEFVCCNVYDLPDNLNGQFDVVYTSLGVLCWLPDLAPWAEVIAHFLKPDGVFYMYEFHPFMCVFAYEDTPQLFYPYFHNDEPLVEEMRGSYAAPKEGITGCSHEWSHSLSDVVSSLLAVGLRLDWLHEFPFVNYAAYQFLSKGDDGLWRYGDPPHSLPLTFSIRATKE